MERLKEEEKERLNKKWEEYKKQFEDKSDSSEDSYEYFLDNKQI